MTFRELLQIEHPDKVDEFWVGGCFGCPCDYGYESSSVAEVWCSLRADENVCRRCWDRESGRKISDGEKNVEPVAESDDLDETDEPTCNFCSHYKDTPWCVDCEDKCLVCAHEAVCKFKDEFFGERKICRNFLKMSVNQNA